MLVFGHFLALTLLFLREMITEFIKQQIKVQIGLTYQDLMLLVLQNFLIVAQPIYMLFKVQKFGKKVYHH